MPVLSDQRLLQLRDQGAVVVEVDIEVAPPTAARQRTIRVPALIDTGTDHTIIRYDLVSSLGLSAPQTWRKINPIGSGKSASFINVPGYDVRLSFPYHGVADSYVVYAANFSFRAVQCLIGREVLARGLFVYIGNLDA